MMTGKQKLYFLLDTIDDVRTITPSGQPFLEICPTDNLNKKLTARELELLLDKLEKDEKVLEVLRAPTRVINDILQEHGLYQEMDNGRYRIKLLPTFDEYFLKIQYEPEYQEFTGKKPLVQTKTKLSRKALEKIWGILQEIEDKRGITIAGGDIPVQQAHLSKTKNDREAQAASNERYNLLKKLENEDKAVKDVSWPKGFHQSGYLKIGDRYFEALDYYRQEYKNTTKDYQQIQGQEEIKNGAMDVIYEVRYSEQTRKILVNGFLLKQPRSFGNNEAIFAFLYSNANQDKSAEDIKNGTGLKVAIDLNKFVENIGFTGDLRKVFFKVSKDKIKFNNPITRNLLDELGIDRLKLG